MNKISRAIKYISIITLLVAFLVPAASASAALRICRTDPLIYFANGDILSVTASIAADPDMIKEIVYTVHAPAGSEVTRIVHTAGGLGLEETVNMVDDQPDGVYIVETIVHTVSGDAPVTTMVMLVRGQYAYTSGMTSQILSTMVTSTR